MDDTVAFQLNENKIRKRKDKILPIFCRNNKCPSTNCSHSAWYSLGSRILFLASVG